MSDEREIEYGLRFLPPPRCCEAALGLIDEAVQALRDLGAKCDGWQQRAEAAEAMLARSTKPPLSPPAEDAVYVQPAEYDMFTRGPA